MTRCDVFPNFTLAFPQFAIAIRFIGAATIGLVLDSTAYPQVTPQFIEKALARSAKQPDALYDRVSPKEAADCKADYETRNGVRGPMISSPNGQPLRWLADTNGDGKVDQICFYKDGVEAYRDMDTDFDDKIDQSRWLGTSGLRWGIDKDQDGTIDQWKMISAEEVSYELVEAVRSTDLKRFERLLISTNELEEVGLGAKRAAEISETVKKAPEAFRALISSAKGLEKGAKWTSFGADKPGIVPAGTDDSTIDIVAYENAIAVIDSPAGPQQLVMGTLVKVGDAWRLIGAPHMAGEETASSSNGMFFASTSSGQMASLGAGAGVLSADTEKLIRDMETLEKRLTEAKIEDKPDLNAQKADLLQRLIESSSTPVDTSSWTRQMADQILSAVQAGEYPEGIVRLKKLEAKIQSIPDAKPETPYVAYRVLTAEYNLAIGEKNANFQQIQDAHLKNLESFVEKFPENLDSADAMIQLGLNSELANEMETAQKWYHRVEASFPNTPQGEKAHGAIQRLNLVGQQITFSGNTINGKTFSTAKLNKPVIIHYWASWCGPCKADMKEFKKLQSKYAKAGLAVVGINADNDTEQAVQYLKANPDIDWVQLHEKGGLESKIAVGLGVFSLPVTIIIDKSGKVVEASSHYSPNLEVSIQGLLK